ncbi:hypothetical protein Mapa_009145 [Marchantia paleacea]|nr:hypothetical protein Mapa_009145 [Marchantia paleacea]
MTQKNATRRYNIQICRNAVKGPSGRGERRMVVGKTRTGEKTTKMTVPRTSLPKMRRCPSHRQTTACCLLHASAWRPVQRLSTLGASPGDRQTIWQPLLIPLLFSSSLRSPHSSMTPKAYQETGLFSAPHPLLQLLLLQLHHLGHLLSLQDAPSAWDPFSGYPVSNKREMKSWPTRERHRTEDTL